MQLSDFLFKIKNAHSITFQETMAVIAEHYHYQPVAFSNGINSPILNEAGSNEGSCKIFAFAQLHQLNQAQTLSLFGDYYFQDVLLNPEGKDHANIRQFMKDGWEGIVFQGNALQAIDEG